MPEQSFSPDTDSALGAPLNPTNLKLPPHSVEAEQAVLGGLMHDNSAWDDVAETLMAGDFYRKEHRLIFQAMVGRVESGHPIDIVTIAEALDNANELSAAGGLDYLSELVDNTPSIANIRAYARIVRERALLRRLITVANTIADSAFNPNGRESAELLDMAEQQVFNIADERPNDSGPQALNPLLKNALEKIDELFNAQGNLTGLATGFKDLDEMTSGLQRSDLIIVAGRPSMGKTSFAMCLVEHAILHSDKPVLVFSLEMPADSLIMRMLSSLGRIDQSRIRSGKLEEDDWPRLTAAINKLKDRPLFIDDTPGLSPMEMRSRARRVAREHGDLGLVMVDYLQLMQIKGSNENRTTEISEISRALKTMAREFNCPLIALSQLNRGLEQRPNKRPVMSDLRECVTGDTLVCLSDGRRTPIKDLIGSTPEVWAMDQDLRLIPARSDLVWKVGRRPVFRLCLASGRELRATAEHRVFANEDWHALADLKPGDRVALARQLPAPASTPAWPESELIRLAQGLGRDGQDQPLPEAVFALAADQIALLLRHLWAVGGSIHARGDGGVPRICFSTRSRRLAFDIAALLLRLAVVARVSGFEQSGDARAYSVDVPGREHQLRFLQSVGAAGPGAAPALELQKLLLARKRSADMDTLPLEAFQRVREGMRAQGIPQRGMAAMGGARPGGGSHFRVAPSREMLLHYATLLKDESLLRLAESDLFWDRVVAVLPDGEEEVYDLTVPGPANWLADGIVTHNSGAIEQDADLIMFIYRDEVYNPDTEHKGMAEVILGKHRNGPIGTRNLSFIGKYTRFENFMPMSAGDDFGGGYE